MYFPADRSEVTETWLADTLVAHQLEPIESVEFKPLGEGIGQLSTLVLADLVFDSGKKQQVIVKLQADIPAMHDIAMRYGFYESEINFYKFFANQVPMRTPEVFVADWDVKAERVVMIMESFTNWHSPDQVAGATAEEVTIATETLAGLTAAFWNEPIREQHPWIRNMQSEVFQNMPSEYPDNIDEALIRIGSALPRNAEETARKIGRKYAGLMSYFTEGPQVLSHWDYRVENFFYGPDGGFVVIDWQLMMMTRPGADLAYLLCTNIEPELRREVEADLMDLYLEGLHRAGVENYSRNDLERDYRFAMLPVSGIPIIGGASVDITNPRSQALMKAMGRRLFQAIEDWDAIALLP